MVEKIIEYSLEDIKGFQLFLNNNVIPKIKKKPKTFLSIAKQPHYENVISNMYAFYFNRNEEHHLNDLFIKSFLRIINEKLSGLSLEKEINFITDFNVDREYPSNNGRLDILLSTDEEVIYVENKVYHTLNNDLDDYWNIEKYKEIPVKRRIGIVLSLNIVSDIKHDQFINITHIEFLNIVMENIGAYLLESNSKYVVFLKDLYQNIINLSKSFMNKQDLDFYLNNQMEIDKIAKFKFAVREHIFNELDKAGNSLDYLNLYIPRVNSVNEKRLRYYVCKSNSSLMITVVVDKLMTRERKMYIAVELQGKGLNNRANIKIDSFTKEETAILCNDFRSGTKDWAHFAIKEYYLTNNDIENLSNFILKKLEEDHLLPIFDKLKILLEK